MKKAYFVVVISLIYLTLVLTIFADKAVAKDISQYRGFLGYAPDSPLLDILDTSGNLMFPIGIFENYSTAWAYTQSGFKALNVWGNNCYTARYSTENECYGFIPQQITWEGGQIPTCEREPLGDKSKCNLKTSSTTSPTTYHVSQLLIQKQCTDAFGAGYTGNIGGLTVKLNGCISGAYEECVTKPEFTDKELKDDPTLTQEQFKTAESCISTYIEDEKKSVTQQASRQSADTTAAAKKITKWELYWETGVKDPAGQHKGHFVTGDEGENISLTKTADLPEPSTKGLQYETTTSGQKSFGYGMTLYIYFDGYTGACYDDPNDPNDPVKKLCKKISFTIRYTPPASANAAKAGGAAGACASDPYKLISCTGRCKDAGCAPGTGEGSVQFCQANNQHGPATGACVKDCKGKCSEDKTPSGVDINTLPSCDYSEPCGNGGTKVCRGKIINKKCTFVAGFSSCESCKGEVGSPNRKCTPGSYQLDCTGCDSKGGLGHAKQCNKDGTDWGDYGKIYNDPSCNYKCTGGGSQPKPNDPCAGYPESCTKATGGIGTHYCQPGKILDSGACGYSGDIANTTCSECQ